MNRPTNHLSKASLINSLISGCLLSIHAEAILKERELDIHWIEATIETPDMTLFGEDGNFHYIVLSCQGVYTQAAFGVLRNRSAGVLPFSL